jgi:hypothetical protein
MTTHYFWAAKYARDNKLLTVKSWRRTAPSLEVLPRPQTQVIHGLHGRRNSGQCRCAHHLNTRLHTDRNTRMKTSSH